MKLLSIKNSLKRTRFFLSGRSAQKGYLSVLDQAVVSGSNFLTLLLLGRAVSPSEFGEFVLAWTTLMILMSIQNALILTPMAVLAPQKTGSERMRYYGSLSVVQAALAGLLGCFLVALPALFPVFGLKTAGGAQIFSLMGFVSIFFLCQEWMRRVLISELEVKKALVNDIVTHAVRMSGLLSLSSQEWLTGTNGTAVLGISAFAGCVAGYEQVKDRVSVVLRRFKKDFIESWHFGKWVLAEIVPYTLSVQGYTYMTAAYIDLASAAALAACQNVLNGANVLLLALVNVSSPEASRRYAQGGETALREFMIKTAALAGIPVAGFYCLASLFPERILALLYKERYAGYGVLIVLCSVYFSISFVNRVLQVYLNAKRLPQAGFAAKTAALLLMLILAHPLLRYYGLYGASAGTIITQVIVLSGFVFFVRKSGKLKKLSVSPAL